VKVAVYPGSFDPITNGHLDVVLRAARVFDRLVVAVLENPRKAPLLDAASRVDVIAAAVRDHDPSVADRIEVRAFDGLTVDFCGQVGAGFIVRGLRATSDFETELQLAHNNRRLAPGIDTVFFMTSIEHGYVSSSLVKEIARFGGDVSTMVPPVSLEALERALGVPPGRERVR
jgi:pantetheine-phosphate adenylyltransferase